MNNYWWSAMITLFVFLLGVGMTALAFHVTYPDKSAPQFCPVAGCAIVGVDTVDFWDKAYAAMIKYPHFRLFYGSQSDRMCGSGCRYSGIRIPDTVYVDVCMFSAKHQYILNRLWAIHPVIAPLSDSDKWAPFKEDK